MSNRNITYHVPAALTDILKDHVDRTVQYAVKPDSLSRISPFCHITGDVTLKAGSSVFAGSVLRGDFEPIVIEEDSTIEDGTIIHGGLGYEVHIGEHTTIGHHCMLHGCHIGDNSLIGMNSCIMNGAIVGNNCIIGADTLIPQGVTIPDRWMAYGHPVRLIRELSDGEIEELITIGAESYLLLSQRMLEQGVLEAPSESLLKRIGSLPGWKENPSDQPLTTGKSTL